MKTIGVVLKEARISRKISLEDLEKRTKIKRLFIKLIEEEKWNELPEYATIQGFVKNIGKDLHLKEEKIAALFRRDYPPRDLSINPKPDVSEKFAWSPKTSFMVGIATVTLVVGGYLGLQYRRFVRPPKIEILSPVNGQEVEDFVVEIKGNTDGDVVVTANNQPILVDENGYFSGVLEIGKDTFEIKIVAISRSGKETIIHRDIVVKD